MLGRLISAPLDLLNAPLRALENITDIDGDLDDEDRVLSQPLTQLAKEIRRAVDQDDDGDDY